MLVTLSITHIFWNCSHGCFTKIIYIWCLGFYLGWDYAPQNYLSVSSPTLLISNWAVSLYYYFSWTSLSSKTMTVVNPGPNKNLNQGSSFSMRSTLLYNNALGWKIISFISIYIYSFYIIKNHVMLARSLC